MGVTTATYTNGLTTQTGSLTEVMTALQTAKVTKRDILFYYWDASANNLVVCHETKS